MKITLQSTTKAVRPGTYTQVLFDATSELVRTPEHEGALSLVLGIEGQSPLTRRTLVTLIRRIILEAKARRQKRLHLALGDLEALAPEEIDRAELLRILGENLHMANYEFVRFKEAPKKGWNMVEEVRIQGDVTVKERASLTLGEIVAEEVNSCRDLANTPGGDMTPSVLAAHAKKAARGTGLTVQVLGKKDMEKLGMGAVLGVAKGSTEEPKFIIAEYWGGKKKAAPTVLVGKGITFDSGGLNLQPAGGLEMHLDMSGGAAVLHAVIAAARLKLPVNVVALIPAAENMPSGESYRPGDILRSMSGKTIEILNTDAEGRLLLADALTYAVRYKPSAVLDVATLTGGALIALGTKASALMSKDDRFVDTLCALGEQSGDYCWPFPLWDEFKYTVASKFADVANIASEQPRYGQTINGGMFLAEFATGYPEGCSWAHIDMAPRMTSTKGDHLAPGAAGAPVRLLVRFLEHMGRKS